jgi:predicted lipid-binding transport protein (Tim44 family)/sortase (surface protein transpeptidase)
MSGTQLENNRMKIRGVFIFLCTLLVASIAWGRGGGGCLEEGTLIATPAGRVPIEQLARGDAVWTVVDGELQPAMIQATVEVAPAEYVEIAAAGRILRVTAEHPLQIDPGVFRAAANLRPGDTLYLRETNQFRTTQIDATTRVKAVHPAFNLLVMPGGTYLANDIVVHNKGCFLPDTPILRADGTSSPISEIRPGDELIAFTTGGEIVHTTVRRVIIHEVDEYVVVGTEQTTLRVTREHPFFVGDGTFKTLEALQVGDRIFAVADGGLREQVITSLETVLAPTRVYNLQTDHPNTYFANGIAVHNKGGGGGGGGGFGGGGFGGGGSSGGGSGDPMIPLIFVGVVVLILVIKFLAQKQGAGEDEDLDYVYTRSDIERKAGKTRKLLEFLARVDQTMAPDKLEAQAKSTFLELQKCWQARQYDPMKPLMMPDLYAEHCSQISGMIANHEINMISNLNVEHVDIVNVRYPQKEADREFTALITATARDYYVDDRTQEFLRGDEEPARFQEFWTFHRQGGAWLLREIDQSRESDALKEENFFEQFTDVGLNQVYDETAGKEGPAGPWLEKETLDKATRIERLLNFLVQTDKLWDRQAMLERARQVFLDVTLAREKGDPAAIPNAELFPDVAASLQGELVRLGGQGTQLEFRNLCVRKAELILVRNYSDNSQDEFTVRISAHAQRAVRRNNLLISQDADVTPFVEFWTFGRLDNEWKLKEVLPPARGGEMVAAENVDEGTSPEQLQWYYKQTRAN